MRGIDWFAGVGGYTLAMRRAGIEVVGACECNMTKRVQYVERFGVPEWYSDDAFNSFRVPDADIWTACSSVPDLLAWLFGHPKLATWTVMECVRADLPELLHVVTRTTSRISVLPAGMRVFVVIGPREAWPAADLPAHDGRGPESTPEALDIVLRAILEAS